MNDAIDQIAGAEVNKPRVLLLGEFSAGKSTLANILLGSAQSPVRVTATQMPPIWYVAGTGDPIRVTSDGEHIPIDMADITRVPLEGTGSIRVPLGAPILEQIDLIDMPGSSDPNMSPDIWNDLLPMADLVLWCTPATQAWRQSEAALWETVETRVQIRSLLLLTRIDKVANATDLDRLKSRVKQETAGLFRAILPVSLVGKEGEPASGSASDLADFMAALQDVIANPEPSIDVPDPVTKPATTDVAQRVPRRAPTIMPRRISTSDAPATRSRPSRKQAGDRLI